MISYQLDILDPPLGSFRNARDNVLLKVAAGRKIRVPSLKFELTSFDEKHKPHDHTASKAIKTHADIDRWTHVKHENLFALLRRAQKSRDGRMSIGVETASSIHGER